LLLATNIPSHLLLTICFVINNPADLSPPSETFICLAISNEKPLFAHDCK
jgi:hypothetical protein